MVIQDANGRIEGRTAGQKFTRLVWVVAKSIASVALTVSLCAMFPYIAFAFFGLIGLGWFIKNGARVFVGGVKGTLYVVGAIVATIWKRL